MSIPRVRHRLLHTPLPFINTPQRGKENQLSKSFNSQSFTLTAGTAKLLAPLNLARQGMLLQNNGGSNPVTLKFQTAPVSATDGFTLDPASTSGGQGGTLLLEGANETPIDALYAYSTLGTTVTLHEMVEYA
jgi:hypothetical protein